MHHTKGLSCSYPAVQLAGRNTETKTAPCWILSHCTIETKSLFGREMFERGFAWSSNHVQSKFMEKHLKWRKETKILPLGQTTRISTSLLPPSLKLWNTGIYNLKKIIDKNRKGGKKRLKIYVFKYISVAWLLKFQMQAGYLNVPKNLVLTIPSLQWEAWAFLPTLQEDTTAEYDARSLCLHSTHPGYSTSLENSRSGEQKANREYTCVHSL